MRVEKGVWGGKGVGGKRIGGEGCRRGGVGGRVLEHVEKGGVWEFVGGGVWERVWERV